MRASDLEDEVTGTGVVNVVPGDGAPECEVVRIRDLLGGDQPWAHRCVAAAGLPERELRAGGELERAVAYVLTNRETCDVGPRNGLVDPIGEGADHGDELDLPIDGPADDLDVVERSGERCRRPEEHTSELQSPMRISDAGFRFTKK